MTAKARAEKVEEDVHCDNHPDRKGKVYTGGGAYEIHLCDDCKPSWDL